MSDKTICTICGSSYRSSDEKRHLNTTKHKKALEESDANEPSIPNIFTDESVNMENPFEALTNPDTNEATPTNVNFNDCIMMLRLRIKVNMLNRLLMRKR